MKSIIELRGCLIGAGDITIFSIRPTSVQLWHMAVFKMGLVTWPKPTHPHKNTFSPVGISLIRGTSGDGRATLN